MPVASFKRKSKVAMIVPLAVVSGLWTVSAVATGGASASGAHNHALPDGTKVPSTAIQAPASLPQPGIPAPAVPQGQADAVVASASTSGIPATAVSAYQNAARIIDSADKTCNIPWELIAAIGRVESDHGRYDGNHLTAKGIAQPGIFGPLLDGQHGTQVVADTDGGLIDGNKQYDRAVGPMQFIPSTWQVVKVDADNDGKRDPQDINDASLATAVYLCSGQENLSQRAGQQSAVYRYNHSHDYVNLVLRIMEAYQAGDYTSVPSDSYGGTLFSPNYTSAVQSHRTTSGSAKKSGHSTGSTTSGSGAGTGTTGSGTGTGTGTGSGSGSGSGGTGAPGGGSTSGTDPVTQLGNGLNSVISAAPSALSSPLVQVLSAAEALTVCNQQLAQIPLIGNLISQAAPLCAKKVTGQTEASAIGVIPNTLTGLLNWLGL